LPRLRSRVRDSSPAPKFIKEAVELPFLFQIFVDVPVDKCFGGCLDLRGSSSVGRAQPCQG
jgi:hypothetical protein